MKWLFERWSHLPLVLLAFTPICAAQHMGDPTAPCRQAVVTSDMVACFAREAKVADQDLKRRFQQILAILGAEDKRRLRAGERLWIRYREEACSAERALYDGGTGGPPTYLACLSELSRQRTHELNLTYGWLLEK